jgi:hypothetical protein
MQMERETYDQLKKLLLGIPGWNHGGTRKAFLQDVFWGHDLLNQLNYEVPGERAAIDLIELLGGMEAPDVDGLTPACALLRAIRGKYGALAQREKLLSAVEQDLCKSANPLRSMLYLAANPRDQKNIRTDLEYKKIKEILAASHITLQPPELASRPNDLSRALHQTKPDLVHFSGHGGGAEGIFLEDDQGNTKPVEAEALVSLFRQFSHCVKVVVLNACLSEPQAEAIAKQIDYVIGTRLEIGDDTAITFSVGFYQAFAAGRPVEEAFQLGCAEIRMAGIPEHDIPVLIRKGRKRTTCA